MKTHHRIFYSNAKHMTELQDQSIDLVVTSPPYPMIKLWDETFASMNPKIREQLEKGNGAKAFDLMHKELEKVWIEVIRVAKPGSFVCINIGDATRSIGEKFQLYPSHCKIIDFFTKNGFVMLPSIIWRKPTNAPTKFMGSGMLPAGAYVTLEHEYILIFKKKGKRAFTRAEEKTMRRESAFFWEERNKWFSDIWEFPGIRQQLDNKTRTRSAAFPFELAYRLINMYSIKGDYILDPFLGTGTTILASIVAARNSYGYELDHNFEAIIVNRIKEAKTFGNSVISDRLKKHENFVKKARKNRKTLKYHNEFYAFPVVTMQETKIKINVIQEIRELDKGYFEVTYKL